MKCNFLEKILTITPILSLNINNIIVNAKEPSNHDFFITTKGCSIAQIIEDVGANNGICVHNSPNVKSIFIGTLQENSFEKLLEKFSKTYNLIWYKNSNDIYIYNIQELSRKNFILNFGDFNEFYSHLNEMNLTSLPFTTIVPMGDTSFEVSGPPEWITQISKVIDTWNNQENDIYRKKENVYFFPLKYASAEDKEVKYLEQTVTIPGVATILNNIINSTTKKDVSNNDKNSNETASTIIMADNRSNSIIIKDRNDCFESLSSIIQTLDIAVSQIEISVSIIDIDTRFSYEVGSRLGISSDNFNINQHIHNNSIEFNNNYQLNNKNTTLHFSANVNDTIKFETELEALEINSGVKVIAQPSILTIDNQKAILEKSTTIYTKLTDENTTKLEPITSGTLLEVTPRLISLDDENKDKDAIFLQIHIRDGKIDNKVIKNVQSAPETNSSEIFTQAILKEGEGLLLGGFVREENSDNELGIPFINKIPILNLIFGKKHHQNNKLIRLFYLKAVPINLENNILNSNNK